MRTIDVEPLTAERFAPFGEVLEVPALPGRVYIEQSLASSRAGARPSLSFVRAGPAAAMPLEARLMERHAFSSQSFIPLTPVRWLVLVAPHDPEGRPDVEGARAFLAGPGQGVTYRMDRWHHPLTVLDGGASFAILMWRDGTAGDEEFVDLAAPCRVALP